MTHLRKDRSLDFLADRMNVAQFVSFAPKPFAEQQYCRVLGFPPNHRFNSLRTAATALLGTSPDGSVNVRSFTPSDPRSKEFVYGLRSVDEICQAAERILRQGLFIILNETVDVHDGGVSGVVQGGIIEFSPDDTPRCVEKPGVVSLPYEIGRSLLRRVYGVELEFPASRDYRIEFSVHPSPRGWKDSHVLGWEFESTTDSVLQPTWQWPNNFSKMIGDKAYGLLIAAELGFPVPKTTVISRRIAPFSFGSPTGNPERWIRTSPRVQIPGRFTTHRGWIDPFALMHAEDPEGSLIASILSQHGIIPNYSGACILGAHGETIVEGKSGEGEVFMKGDSVAEPLPSPVMSAVLKLFEALYGMLGPVRFEWVFDGNTAWVAQLHLGATETSGNQVVAGDADDWIEFDISQGLESLRHLVTTLSSDQGLLVLGRFGLTSHIADVLRKAGHPARRVSSTTNIPVASTAPKLELGLRARPEAARVKSQTTVAR